MVESSVEMPCRCAVLDAVEDLRIHERLAQPDQHHVLGGSARPRAPAARRSRRSCPLWAACASRAGTSGSRGCTSPWSRRCTPPAARAHPAAAQIAPQQFGPIPRVSRQVHPLYCTGHTEGTTPLCRGSVSSQRCVLSHQGLALRALDRVAQCTRIGAGLVDPQGIFWSHMRYPPAENIARTSTPKITRSTNPAIDIEVDTGSAPLACLSLLPLQEPRGRSDREVSLDKAAPSLVPACSRALALQDRALCHSDGNRILPSTPQFRSCEQQLLG